MEARYERSYSMRLLRPFLAVLRQSGRIANEVLAPLDALDADDRFPIAVVHQMLKTAGDLTGDPDLGLKAARRYSVGDSGAVYYAITSAPTVGDALKVAARYIRLVNDAVELHMEQKGERVTLRFESSVAMLRPSVDFQVGAFYRNYFTDWAASGDFGLSVSFVHPKPDDTTEYELTFGHTPLEFAAPFSGFALDRRFLDTPLRTADSSLHEVIRRAAEATLAELPRAETLTERVRSVVASELPGGSSSVVRVAKKLHMSPRTLERKLAGEGTTFSALLEELRRQLAFRYVGADALDLSEVALLLGFSQTSAFHRAFKRWTGQTPLHYRRARRSLRPP